MKISTFHRRRRRQLIVNLEAVLRNVIDLLERSVPVTMAATERKKRPTKIFEVLRILLTNICFSNYQRKYTHPNHR